MSNQLSVLETFSVSHTFPKLVNFKQPSGPDKGKPYAIPKGASTPTPLLTRLGIICLASAQKVRAQ